MHRRKVSLSNWKVSLSNFALIALTLALAVALTFIRIPVASSQGLTVVAANVRGELPVKDFDSSLWKKSTAVEVPLSAQAITAPSLTQTKVKSVTARALHNGAQLAVLVAWADDTKNEQMVRIQDFRDAVALQFPLVEGLPFICMGQPGTTVNIWHWKADWQADLTARQDMETLYPNMNVDQYPFADGARPAPRDYKDANYVPAFAANNLFAATHTTPVEDLVAGGFGTLTAKPADHQRVQGYGAWANGQWRVILSRALDATAADDAKFAAGKIYPIAFAAWDGANGERDGQKSTSQWVSLKLEAPPEIAAAQPSLMNLLLIGLALI
ncbi:MAG: hypothetical protein HYR71_09655, partial [Chloroflexi bacterium]|nr:hypothetical protein [Chloroflexota bacterium]